MVQVQLQDVEDVPSIDSQALWCTGQPQHTEQTELKMCAVKLVDVRKIQTLYSNIIPEEHLPPGGESTRFDGDQERLQTQLKMSSVRLVDYRKATAEDKSSRFDGDQQTLHSQLKIGFVRLVDCGKIQSRKATSEDEPEDRAYDHEYPSDFISSIPDKSTRFDGDQHTQLKMSSVRLVDCRKIQNRQRGEREDETYDLDSVRPSKTRRFDGDGQLKMCLVRLVDCGKIQSSKAAAGCEPEDGVYGHESN